MRNVLQTSIRLAGVTALGLFSSSCDKPDDGRISPTAPALAASVAVETGLDFPANEQGADTRFRFSGSARPAMWPATYIWRSNHRNQPGYYGVWYWGADATFYGANYYGPRPYPDGYKSLTHKWSIAANGNDPVNDANGHPTQVGYDTWRTQAFRAYDNGSSKVMEFYWDLPDTTKVIRYQVSRDYGSNPPSSAVLTFGATPGSPSEQRYNGILRGIQVYASKLEMKDVLAETGNALSTPAGAAGIWYLNVNPTPSDISDKSGKGHHPEWVGAGRPGTWQGEPPPGGNPPPTVSLTADPSSVTGGNASTLTWSSTNATSCEAGGAWSGTKETGGSQSTGALSATVTYTLTCSGPGGAGSASATVTVNAPPVPTVSLTANPTSIAAGGSSTLTWSSANATSCNASGAWNGNKQTSGSQSTGTLNATKTYTLTCTGPGGSANASATVTVNAPTPAPTVSLSANPSAIGNGESSTLTWSSANATSCNASGAWSGSKATGGSQSTGALSATSTYTLTCTGAGGSANKSVTVTVEAPPGGGATTGLDFPSNGGATNDVRFRFKGSSLQPMYPATYIWKVKLRPQCGYYTTFFWGPDGSFTGTGYYGFHPYPDSPPGGCSHKWEVSVNGNDYVNDANGHNTQVQYDTWTTQAARVYSSGGQKIHEFFWNLPDTTKVIKTIVYSGNEYNPPSNPALTFGTAPWAPANEHLSGILRGIQTYTTAMSGANILAEANSPLSTSAGGSSIWYLNLNPTPTDISDKSGKGHHPEWVTSLRPALWTGP